MKYRNLILAVVLLALLVGVAALAMGSTPEQMPQPSQSAVGSLQITEICTKNESVIANNAGKYRDYIELHAPTQAVNLKGFTFTDGKATSAPLGDITLQPGEYRIFFLSDEDTGFALGAAGGDSIQVRSGDGDIAAQATTTAMAADQVMILVDGRYTVTDQASPGFANDAAGVAAFRDGFHQESPKLVISELAVRNESLLPDEKGIYSDVVELHNVSGQPIDLGDYYLSDSLDHRFAYRLPEVTLEADGYIVVYCDGENYVTQGFIHANFALSRGESICLTDSSGGYLSLCGDEAGEDTSCQRMQDGSFAVGVPSLGWPNTQEGVQQAQEQRTASDSPLVISEVLLSSSGVPYNGAVCDAVEIQNVSDQTVSTSGWYLSDGGDPYSYCLPQQLLQPGECLVVVCDRTGTGFGLSQGEVLRLTGPDFRHAPLLTCTEGPLGQSVSLTQDAQAGAYLFGGVSLGFANDEAGCASYLAQQQPKNLRISEVMTSNESYFYGPYGATSDWLELYNAGSEPIDLSNFCLTDNPRYTDKYPLPQMLLEPGQYCTLYLTRDSSKARRGYGVVAMELSSKGDQVYLTSNGRVEDFVLLPELDTDVSYGRAPGEVAFSQLAKPTPEAQNRESAAVSADPVAVTAPGCYDGVEYLDVVLSGAGELYYTTDCESPSSYSRRYTGPIRITQNTVLRVVCYEEGKTRSNTVDLTYILNEGDELSVVSIVTPRDNLWDHETGIYADGPNITEEFPYLGANYHNNWEKPASVTLFEADGSGGFSERCGLRIFGGYTRAYQKKSLACMFRKSYGASDLEYPLFGEENSLPYYEAFVLRSGGQDAFNGRMRDELATSLASDYLGIPVQQYRPVNLYINGKYWGLYYIREKINSQYVAGNFSVDAEDVIMTSWSGGDCREYIELRAYASNHDLSEKEHYEYIESRVDLDNYIDYMIAQMWINNRDNSNVKYFTTPNHKWTWILFDTDMAFSEWKDETIPNHLSSAGPDYTARTILVRLLRNPEFRDRFLGRMAWQLNHVWTQENVIARIDELQAVIAQDMHKEAERWFCDYDEWLNDVELLRKFARRRNDYFIPAVQRYFGLTDRQMIDYGFPMK